MNFVRISKYIYGFLIIAILLGGIGIAKLVGVWEVSAKYNLDGSEVVLIDVDDIKGYMSLDEVISSFNLDKEEMYQYMKFPADLPTSTLFKDIKGITGIDPEPIKDFITEQLNKN